ncbi:DUF3592 domain-containing protein [Microtetraspora glauca]|uniref:DUF3592 domain-containing protein n=1 Tax=Microtetraspora glauca TaxID=1996 RepID=A0ABV3GTX4_MICGL
MLYVPRVSDTSIALLVLGLHGVIFTLLGAGLLINARNFRKRALRAQGQVVGLRRSESSEGYVYYPILRFTTVYGQVVQAESDVGSDPPSARQGQHVAIMYDPADPARLRIDNLTDSGTLLAGIFLGVGLLLLFSGIAVGVVTIL